VEGGREGQDDHTVLQNQQVVNLYSRFWDSGSSSTCCLPSLYIVGTFARRVATDRPFMSVRLSGYMKQHNRRRMDFLENSHFGYFINPPPPAPPSSVSIVTRLWAGLKGFQIHLGANFEFTWGQMVFLFSKISRPSLRPI